jgi:hypothetical protein
MVGKLQALERPESRTDYIFGIRPANRPEPVPGTRHESGVFCRSHKGHRFEYFKGTSPQTLDGRAIGTMSWYHIGLSYDPDRFLRATSATESKICFIMCFFPNSRIKPAENTFLSYHETIIGQRKQN